MNTEYCIFPARRKWPLATDDVLNAPLEVDSLRLISGARNLRTLERLKKLKALWCFDISDRDLELISDSNSIESLYIENVKTEKLEALKKISNLKVLSLETCSKTKSLEALRGLNLIGLAITHFKNVHDLAPLAELKSLKALAVAGSMYTKMKVKSFKPLEELKQLEFLHLTNIKSDDESLKPLSMLSNLRQLDIANFYKTSEFAWLSQKLPSTQCTWFKPYIDVTFTVCKSCGNETMVMLSGSRKPKLCKACDKQALAKHVREWNEFSQNNA